MQPSPDAVGRVQGRHQQHERRVRPLRRARRSTSPIASGTNAFRGSAWEFMRDTKLNATGFFKPPAGVKPPLERDQFGGVLGGPIIKNKAFFFADYEGFRQTRGLATTLDASRRWRSARACCTVDVRNPLTGSVYPAGTPDPDDGVRAQGARTSCRSRPTPGRANNYADPAGVRRTTPTRPAARSTSRSARALSVFGRVRLARRRHLRSTADLRCRRAAPATATPTSRNKQFAIGVDLHRRRHVAARGRASAGRTPTAARIRWRSARRSAARAPTASPACRPIRACRRRPADAADHRLLGPRPPGDQPAVAVSRRSSTRRSTTRGCAAGTR